MSLAAVSSPSVSLVTGAQILQNVGVSPLILTTLGLLSRVLDGINRNTHALVQPRLLKLVETITVVGLILGIVGGINASKEYTRTEVWPTEKVTKISNVLYIFSFVAVLVAAFLTSFSISHAANGEKRILLGVAIALPILFVRLLYSILSAFVTNSTKFKAFDGSVTILLFMALLEELAIVVIYMGMGLTLKVRPEDMVVVGELQRIPGSCDSIGEPLSEQSPERKAQK